MLPTFFTNNTGAPHGETLGLTNFLSSKHYNIFILRQRPKRVAKCRKTVVVVYQNALSSVANGGVVLSLHNGFLQKGQRCGNNRSVGVQKKTVLEYQNNNAILPW